MAFAVELKVETWLALSGGTTELRLSNTCTPRGMPQALTQRNVGVQRWPFQTPAACRVDATKRWRGAE